MKAARIVDGVVVDVAPVLEGFKIEDCFVQGSGYIEANEDVRVGWTHASGKFGPPPELKPPKLTMDQVRSMRDHMLRECDWTQLMDTPEDIREKYRPYRQALRDLPSQFPDPTNVKFPEPPKL